MYLTRTRVLVSEPDDIVFAWVIVDMSPVVKGTKRPLQSRENQMMYNLFKSIQESDYNSSHYIIVKTMAVQQEFISLLCTR